MLARPALDEVWAWLGEVPDPEIPVISIVDLGIVRDVAWSADDAEMLIVTVTPTYSGCPATEVIGQQIVAALEAHGVLRVKLRTQLAPAWTTDWLTEDGRERLRAYGIAPPMREADRATGDPLQASLVVLGQGAQRAEPACPLCASTHTEMISRFGSTPCKSLHRCLDCREPFDHFKCH